MITSLNKLPLNCSGFIMDIKASNTIKRRLLDLGVINGVCITPILKSPLNDPRAYLVKGSVIALRNGDSKNIIVSADKNYKEV